VIAGLAAAMVGAQKWMENFVYKSPLHWEIFVLCGLFVLFFIAFISAIYYVIVANRNPVEALRHE
jgi:putative ABC transport system permease protein